MCMSVDLSVYLTEGRTLCVDRTDTDAHWDPRNKENSPFMNRSGASLNY